MIRSSLKRAAILGVGGLLASAAFASSASGAIGLRSYEGSDYSEDYGVAGGVRACDMESDARDVYAAYQVSGSGTEQHIYDSNGANNGCESSGDYGSYKIYKHRIVETINAYPDNYGPWRYPS